MLALVLGGCSTPSSRLPAPGRDGPGDRIPPGLERLPDAEPRVEPLRRGGPNKPYEVMGRWYTPASGDVEWRETGLASWYGARFHGRPTASGEIYDMFAMTAAHKTLPLPSYARVTNPANGRRVVVRVNDRGPFVDGRVIDLSYAAALRLGVLGGVAPVDVERITHDEIRAGDWAAAARETTAAPDPGPPADPLGALLAERGWAPAAVAAGGHWLQLGSFGLRDAALRLRDRLLRQAEDLGGLLSVSEEGGLTRLHAGPYPTRADAERAAGRLQAWLDEPPLLFERR